MKKIYKTSIIVVVIFLIFLASIFTIKKKYISNNVDFILTESESSNYLYFSISIKAYNNLFNADRLTATYLKIKLFLEYPIYLNNNIFYRTINYYELEKFYNFKDIINIKQNCKVETYYKYRYIYELVHHLKI